MIKKFKIFEKYWKIPKTKLEEICDSLKLDFNDIEYISSGNYGDAYKINDKVLKITSDVREYVDVKNIIGKNKPGIVKYFDTKIYKPNCFIILMEYVTPLSEYIINKYDYENISDLVNILFGNWFKIKNISDYISFIEEEYIIDRKHLTIIQKLYKFYSKIKQLNRPDVHIGNIGVDKNGDFIMFDYNKLINYR